MNNPEQINDSNRTGVIYALCDPRNPRTPKYIGKTVMGLRRRLSGHLAKNSGSNPELRAWIEILKSEGFLPNAYAIETCSIDNLKLREECWIAFYKPLGILNRSYGDGMKGLKGYVSPLNRQITIARNKLGLSEETKKKISISNSGKKQSRETVKKMMASNGYKLASVKLAETNLKNSKSIFCETTGKRFISLRDAARVLKCGAQNIRNSIIKNRKFRGFVWAFEKENL